MTVVSLFLFLVKIPIIRGTNFAEEGGVGRAGLVCVWGGGDRDESTCPSWVIVTPGRKHIPADLSYPLRFKLSYLGLVTPTQVFGVVVFTTDLITLFKEKRPPCSKTINFINICILSTRLLWASHENLSLRQGLM